MRELLSGHPADRFSFDRRGFLRLAMSGAAALSVGQLVPGWASALEAASERPVKRCILLFMGGGASQLETFDCKPGTDIGGDQKTIPTTVPGLEINEYLPCMARQMHHVAVIRSMKTDEGNHARAVYYLHTGYKMLGGLIHPGFGAVAAEQLGAPSFTLPHYVAIPQRVGHHLQGPMPSAGYLGPSYAPYLVDDIANPVKNIATWGGVSETRFATRAALRDRLDADFDKARGTSIGAENSDLYRRAVRMMHSPLSKAFDHGREPPAVREMYGDTPSGKCLLLARRLIESGVSFVEVLLNGWDTHGNHFKRSIELNGALDRPWAALLADLDQRGLLEDTLVVWMGEFGRTPSVNSNKGRDHWANGWSVALAGAGVPGGAVIGSTDDGGRVRDRPVSCEDLYATIGAILGVSGAKTYYTTDDRPVKAIAAEGRPIPELVPDAARGA